MNDGSSVGIDLGGSAVFGVRLTGGSSLELESTFLGGPEEMSELIDFCRGADHIAIDAPSDLCTNHHAEDESLKPKFQNARCGEIALGQEFKIWVPWTTPTSIDQCQRWMVVGFDVWNALRDAGHEPLETYPHGAFTILQGTRPPKKSTVEGLRRRVELLAIRIELPESTALWGHDGLDAAAAALVAADHDPTMRAAHDHADCDESAIWLPSRPEAT